MMNFGDGDSQIAARLPHGRAKAAGSDPRFMACYAIRDVGGHERPRAEWIVVPVPALVSEETFALAQEQLEKNKRRSPPRTIEPTLLRQGVLVCEQCGYRAMAYRRNEYEGAEQRNVGE